jgi:hypothetical protein
MDFLGCRPSRKPASGRVGADLRQVQRYRASYLIEAHPKRVWRALHPRVPPESPSPRLVTYPRGSMQVLTEGDEAGQGLVRMCEFRVPTWLGSGGRAQSWEVVVEARVGEISRYRGVCKPLWARMEGWHSLRELEDCSTRLTFVELYDVVNPLLRRLFAARVHEFISADNDLLYRSLLGQLGAVTTESRTMRVEARRLDDDLQEVVPRA